MHLDLNANSIADSESAVLAASARQPDHKPSLDGRFDLYIDDVGHPLCRCEERRGE